MINKTCLIALFVLCYLAAQAQESKTNLFERKNEKDKNAKSTDDDEEDFFEPHYGIFKTSPLRVLRGELLFLFEFIPNKENTNFHLEAGLGPTFRDFLCYTEADDALQIGGGKPYQYLYEDKIKYGLGYGISLGARNYLTGDGDIFLGFYLAGTANLRVHNFSAEYFTSYNSKTPMPVTGHFTRITQELSFTAGYQGWLKPRFYYDAYVGAGYRIYHADDVAYGPIIDGTTGQHQINRYTNSQGFPGFFLGVKMGVGL